MCGMHMTKAQPSAEFGQVVTYASDLALSNPSAILAARLAVDRLRVLPANYTTIGHARLCGMHMFTVGPSVEFGQVVTYAPGLALSTPSTTPMACLAVDRLLVPPSTSWYPADPELPWGHKLQRGYVLQ